jgi:2',3'-cyclic-nucleotide 2'-phosphodiesterase/3'-nucleotidase
MVREALENAARYFRSWSEASCAAGPLVDRAIPGYNCDTAEGVEYDIDLTRPVGSRVRNLHYLGAPLRDDEPLRIALSSYRAGGSAGYSMFRGAKVVYRSGRAIRDLLAEYWGARGRLPEKPDRRQFVVIGPFLPRSLPFARFLP